MSVIYNIQHLR